MFRKPDPEVRNRENLLGRAMRALPTPEINPDFNARIHRELITEPPVTWRSWAIMRSGLVAAAGSFAVTILLLSLFGGSVHWPARSSSTGINIATSAQTGNLDNVEALIEGANLASVSVHTLMLHSLTPAPAVGHSGEPVPAIHAAPPTHHQQGA